MGEEKSAEPSPQGVGGGVAWKDVAQKFTEAPKKEELGVPKVIKESFKSSEGLSVVVVDTSAFIDGGDRLVGSAEKLVSIAEVMDEMRDSATRHRLAFLPSDIQLMQPSDESLKKVISFARATGDLQSLSQVDLKVLALTYTLEAQVHGTDHLRTKPPPLHVVNVKRLPEPDLPGWGNNVPNLDEWEALENDSEFSETAEKNNDSRILGVQVLDVSNETLEDSSVSKNQKQEQDATENSLSEIRLSNLSRKQKSVNKTVMITEGIDASRGESNQDTGDWLPAVRNPRKQRRHPRKAEDVFSLTSSVNSEMDAIHLPREEITLQTPVGMPLKSSEADVKGSEAIIVNKHDITDCTEGLSRVSLRESAPENHISTADLLQLTDSDDEAETLDCEGDEFGSNSSDDLEIDENHTNQISVDGSEQSSGAHYFSKSTVACATNDFAMQNVLLQMGLRLLTPTGLRLRQLNRWVLKCHACNAVTSDVSKIFCPKCGNGGTLRKISVTIGENGVLQVTRRQRFSTRGTRFSIPLPKGGREAITKNPVLREDQLASKLLNPRNKKKAASRDLNLINTADFSFEAKERSSPLQPPIREALAVFRGKRNPNDNHYSRRRK